MHYRSLQCISEHNASCSRRRRELGEARERLQDLHARARAWAEQAQAASRAAIATLRLKAEALAADLASAAAAHTAANVAAKRLGAGKEGAERRLGAYSAGRREAAAAAGMRRAAADRLRAALAAWRAIASLMRQLGALGRRAANRAETARLGSVARSWRQAVVAAARERRGEGRGEAAGKRGLAEALRHWRAVAATAIWTTRVVTVRGQLAEAAARRQCQTLVRACRTWEEYKEDRSEDSAALSRSSAHQSKFVAC